MYSSNCFFIFRLIGRQPTARSVCYFISTSSTFTLNIIKCSIPTASNLFCIFSCALICLCASFISFVDKYKKIFTPNYNHIILHIKNAYAIMPIGKEKIVSLETQSAPPRAATRGGVLSYCFKWQDRPLGLLPLIPFHQAICKCGWQPHLPEQKE